MIDLSGVARHLRLSVDQIRVAADLLQQGYHPAFIERYRADETGCLPRSTLWTLKLDIDRQMRLEAARQKSKDQLPKDAELDEEAIKFLDRATTEVEIEAALKAFRARRALQLSQERDSQAGQLLEMLIAYDGPKVEDVEAWVADQLSVDRAAGVEALQQTSRLIANLIQCDTLLNEKLRRAIQRKALVQVEFCSENPEAPAVASSPASESVKDGPSANEVAASEVATSEVFTDAAVAGTAEVNNAAATEGESQASLESTANERSSTSNETSAEASHSAAVAHEETQRLTAAPSAEAGDGVADEPVEGPAEASHAAAETVSVDADTDGGQHDSHDDAHDSEAHDDDLEEHDDLEAGSEHAGEQRSGKSRKNAKLTPRQRRRRWLIAMLQPMKTLKRPLTKLTAYQQLMLGRGRRSQLVKTNLDYDTRSLVPIARDTFVSDKHPLVTWFNRASEHALENSVRGKIEADAVADLEEIAQEKLLENAADQLRQHLMRRPVRGHTIMLVDTVGPKAASVAIVGPTGEVLATQEIPCSAQPETVNQNVVKLGELAHKFRVTLVALTNGPARRFLVLTVRELMKQSAHTGLRWTMADRGGAEAYASGRVALRELSANNRRDRAAIWIARCLQNPLAELLKVDINRMRLGSYQRELPQESLKKLVRETIADCVCSRGIDTHHAAVNELLFVPGVEESQAKQICSLAGEGKLSSRAQLCEATTDWPEMQSRQAIGWLRVFGSDQPLDATAIHPEDYRLAQRLIDNTEFQTPAAAPEGWMKPQVAAPMVPGDAASPTSEDSAANEQVAPAENGGEAKVESTGEATGESTGEAVVEAIASDAPVTSDETSTESSDPAPASNVASDTSELSASETESSASEESLSFKRDAAVPESAKSGPKPEYPEEIQASAPTTGPDIDIEKLARGWQVGREKLRWIAKCLNEPFADSRLNGTPIPLYQDMPTLSTLQAGQCVWAVVVGVADFGAFVELSPDCSGLIHISRLSANYIEDPHQCVQVGDLLMTWVVSTDEKKNRVALTALSPEERAAAEALAQERQAERHASAPQQRGRQGSGDRSEGSRPQGQAGGHRQGAPGQAGQRPAGQRQGSAQGGQGQRTGGQGTGYSNAAGNSSDRGRGSRSGGRQGGQDRDRGRGRTAGPRTAKTVVVTSKKPKAVISEAMKEGEEPLRSFSDLLQFYEAKRTDEPPTQSPPPAVTESTPEPTAPSPAEEHAENAGQTPSNENE
jgi:protein Tex